MNCVISRQSPAKVNLILKVLGKREDGYHELATLMERISLCDEMTFIPRNRGITLHCSEKTLPTDEGNIVVRAARMFFDYVGWPEGVEINLQKNIPLAAGLGGGSSNAATTLLALNEMTEACVSREKLIEMGVKLGADVPFFIFKETAWAFGVGERLRKAEGIPRLFFVLVNPGVELSTRRVYEELKYGLTNQPIQYNIPRLQTVPQVVKGMQNDLEEVSERICPVIRKIKGRLRAGGALGVLMSGSGPTVFGIYANSEDAEKAENEMREEGFPFLCSVHAL